MAEQNQHEIPSGWQRAKVGSFLKLKNGYAFKSTDYVDAGEDTVPVIRISDIKIDGANAESAIHISIRKAMKGFEIKDGDQLIAMSGATTGKVGIYRGDSPAYQNQRVGNLKLISEENFNKQFKNYLIREKSQVILDVAHGGAQPNVSAKGVEELEVLVPPLPEQKRIVEKLDSLLAQVETIQQRLNNLPDIIKRFRQSVLAAAVSGKLTEQWRGAKRQVESAEILLKRILSFREESWQLKGKYKAPDSIAEFELPMLPNSWTQCSLDSLVDSNRPICYGILMPKENLPDGVLYVKVRDMKNDYIDLSSLQRTSKSIAEKYSRSSLVVDDILVSIRGTYGRVVYVPEELDGGNITQDSARVATCNLISREYVYHVLRSPILQHYFKSVARGVAVKGVNIGDLRPAPIPLPPLEEQMEIVRLLEQYFALADTLDKNLADAKARVENLTQSILAKAFRGELVPQDPNDEPADKLLERIKAARLEAEKLEKAAKKAAKVKR